MRDYYYKLTMYVTVTAHNEEEAEDKVLVNYREFRDLYQQGCAEMDKEDESADYR